MSKTSTIVMLVLSLLLFQDLVAGGPDPDQTLDKEAVEAFFKDERYAYDPEVIALGFQLSQHFLTHCGTLLTEDEAIVTLAGGRFLFSMRRPSDATLAEREPMDTAGWTDESIFYHYLTNCPSFTFHPSRNAQTMGRHFVHSLAFLIQGEFTKDAVNRMMNAWRASARCEFILATPAFFDRLGESGQRWALRSIRWSPQRHLLFPLAFREQVRQVLLARNRGANELLTLPKEILFVIFGLLAHSVSLTGRVK